LSEAATAVEEMLAELYVRPGAAFTCISTTPSTIYAGAEDVTVGVDKSTSMSVAYWCCIFQLCVLGLQRRIFSVGAEILTLTSTTVLADMGLLLERQKRSGDWQIFPLTKDGCM